MVSGRGRTYQAILARGCRNTCKAPVLPGRNRFVARVPLAAKMRAMLMRSARTPLKAVEMDVPAPAEHQVLLQVRACGVCRTDLHILDGELDRPKLPLVM